MNKAVGINIAPKKKKDIERYKKKHQKKQEDRF